MNKDSTQVSITYIEIDLFHDSKPKNITQYTKSYNILAKSIESGIKIFRKFYPATDYQILGVLLSEKDGRFHHNFIEDMLNEA